MTDISNKGRGLLETFKISKSKVKKWEAEYMSLNGGRRPSISEAPEPIRICYKNCKKIQFHFDKIRKESETSVSVSDEGTWGAHLNRKKEEEERTGEDSGGGGIFLTPTSESTSVRVSLKRKKRKDSSTPFFGNLHEEEDCDEKTDDDQEERVPNFQKKEGISSGSSSNSFLNLTRMRDSKGSEEAPNKKIRLSEDVISSVSPPPSQTPSSPPLPPPSSEEPKKVSQKNWNENYRRINLKKKNFCRFNKSIKRNGNKFNKNKPSAKPTKATSTKRRKPHTESSRITLSERLLPPVNEGPDSSTLRSKTTEELEQLVDDTLIKSFKHPNFRHGQREAILRILKGQSTLVVLSTGSGKSLIYQLPAYLLAKADSRLTIVVSPLISLMEDQLRNMPKIIRAEMLHREIPSSQFDKIKSALRLNEIDVLFMTPETLFSQLKSLKEFATKIGFFCIDEAHCLSQWSHNFRPVYFQLGNIIRDFFYDTPIVGLTATATIKTVSNVAERLNIKDIEGGVIKGDVLRENLFMSVSKDPIRDRALTNLLNGAVLKDKGSIIVYCSRREECERIAAYIRTQMREDTANKSYAEPYHAGLSLAKRKRIYNDFLVGKLKIIVATIAFGMGINKPDIRGVIHYNMPSTLESYVQEIGRAGRDGQSSYCHLFIDAKGRDLNELKRHVYANTVDRVTIRKFVGRIFSGGLSLPASEYRDVVVPIPQLVELLDMPEENIMTLMCYLENHEKHWIRVRNNISDSVNIKIYSDIDRIREKIGSSLVLDFFLKNKSSNMNFKILEIAQSVGLSCESVWNELSKLQFSGVNIDHNSPAFHLHVKDDLPESELDAVQGYLCEKVMEREKNEVYKLQRTFRTFLNVSHEGFETCVGGLDLNSCAKLNTYIKNYFTEVEDHLTISEVPPSAHDENLIRQQMRQFMSIYSDSTWTGRSLARIFHGIASPNFPAKTWYRARGYWKSYLEVDFNVLCKLATKEIVRIRTGLT